MTGSSRPKPPIEERLDQLLDDLSGGDVRRETIDPELSDFATLATAIKDDDDIEWPDAAFPGHLADTLYAGLGTPAASTPNGRASALSWDDEASESTHTGAIPQPVTQMPELIGKRGWPGTRRILGIAAAIAGFGLLTLVLVTIFRGFEDENVPALGGSDDSRPPQLAVTMQTDPLNGNPDIFLVSLDGSEPVNLTNHPANDTFPAWSPDGTQIAFISDRSGTEVIHIMEADGSDVRELNPLTYLPGANNENERHYRNLAWSPDGSAIAVLSYSTSLESNLPEILVFDVDGAGLRGISMNETFPQLPPNQTPIWLSDSELLAFTVANEDESQIAVAGADTGYSVRTLGSGSALEGSSNQDLAYVDDDEIIIGKFSPSSMTITELDRLSLPDAADIGNLAWSLDASHLAFTTSSMSGTTLWLADRAEDELIEIPDSFTGAFPAWSLGGKQLAFLRFGGLFSAESAGYELMLYEPGDGTSTRILDTGFSGPLMSPPAWRPGGTDTSTEDAAAGDAIEQVRDFLGEPDAELIVDQVQESEGRTFVNLSRPAPGREDQPQYADQFFVDVTDNTVFAADFHIHETPVAQRVPFDEETAQELAEDFFAQRNTLSQEFTLMSVDVLRLANDTLTVTWGMQSNGVWLPTTVQVGVSLDTGLVVRYIARDFPYDGPWEAEIPESIARRSAEEIISIDPSLEGSVIESVRLAATFSTFAEDFQNGQVVREVEARWRLAWEFTLVDRPSPDADHFIWIDATTGERLTTGQ